MSREDIHTGDQLASGSIVFALISSFTCWLFPYGAIIGLLGVWFGVMGWMFGNKTERALLGMVIAAFATATATFLAWEYWWPTW